MVERRRQYIRERERIVALHRPDGREKHFLLRPLDGRESRRSASPVYEKEGRAVVAALREQQYVRTVKCRACRYSVERMGENSIERKPPPTGFRPSLHARLRYEPESPGPEDALPRLAEICPAVGLAQQPRIYPESVSIREFRVGSQRQPPLARYGGYVGSLAESCLEKPLERGVEYRAHFRVSAGECPPQALAGERIGDGPLYDGNILDRHGDD